MSYRDELEAARTRADAAERELDEARRKGNPADHLRITPLQAVGWVANPNLLG